MVVLATSAATDTSATFVPLLHASAFLFLSHHTQTHLPFLFSLHLFLLPSFPFSFISFSPYPILQAAQMNVCRCYAMPASEGTRQVGSDHPSITQFVFSLCLSHIDFFPSLISSYSTLLVYVSQSSSIDPIVSPRLQPVIQCRRTSTLNWLVR